MSQPYDGGPAAFAQNGLATKGKCAVGIKCGQSFCSVRECGIMVAGGRVRAGQNQWAADAAQICL
eukprot:3528894-Pyramimonas_sp.AAC.1